MRGEIGISRNKKFIVITGQIASGKSSLAELIKERNENYLVLDADDQIKELYKRGAELYKVLVNEFGDSILNEKGNISKAKLRKIVFLNDENREKLNSLTHPVILNNMVNLAKNSDAEVVFLQIPLLNESIDRLEKLIDIDEIWNVTANDEVRFKRLMERKGITEEIARRIMEIQSEFENENYDILSVENNGDFEELKDKLDLFFKNSCINEGKKVGFFGRLKKSKQEEAEEDKAIVEDKTEDADVVRKLTEDELKAMNTAEEVFNDHPLEKENLNNNENLDGFMKSVFANEQSTENVDLKNLESQNSLNMEKTKLTDLSPLREEKLDSTDSAQNSINNSDGEFFEEEAVEDTKKDKGKKKKKKMKMWKKILITIITVLIICKALFLGAVYYGGKNYPINYI